MTQIICLANSWKHKDRCIAGINPATNQWIRPVSNLPDGRVPKQIRLIGGTEPALLDILEIPLAKTGPDFGFESENVSILAGAWRRVAQVPPAYLLKYCGESSAVGGFPAVGDWRTRRAKKKTFSTMISGMSQ